MGPGVVPVGVGRVLPGVSSGVLRPVGVPGTVVSTVGVGSSTVGSGVVVVVGTGTRSVTCAGTSLLVPVVAVPVVSGRM